MGQRFGKEPSYMDFHTLSEMILHKKRGVDITNFIYEKKLTRKNFLKCRQEAFDQISEIAYPVHTAVRHGRRHLLEVLFAFGYRNRDPKLNWMDPAMHLACIEGQLTIVKWLVEKRHIDVEEPGLYPVANLPVIVAAKGGQFEILEYLLGKGASVNVRNALGKTALHDAAWQNNKAVCEYLLSQGASVNVSDEHGNTPLHETVSCENWRDTGIILLLVEAGADVNARNDRGETPFYIATSRRLPNLMKVLFSYNADPQAVTYAGLTPLNLCITHNHSYETVRTLVLDMNVDMENKKCANTPLYLAIKYGRYAFVDLILAAGYHVKTTDCVFDGDTSLIANDLIEKTEPFVCKLRTLQDVCILTIRRALGTRLSAVDCLPLPHELQSNVRLDHLSFKRPSPYINSYNDNS